MNSLNNPLSEYLNNNPPKWDQINAAFSRVKTQQNTYLQALDNKCSALQNSISYLQKTIFALQSKLKGQTDINERNKLSQLRMKQKQFIIFQLEKKVKRMEVDEETLQASLMDKDSIILDLQQKNQQLKKDNAQMRQQLTKKTKQVKQLIKNNSTLKLAQTLTEKKNIQATFQIPNLSQMGAKKQQMQIRNQYYEQLESRLKQMEDCLNGQIQQHRKKNVKLEQQIRKLNEQLKKQANNAKRIFELELRVRNLTNQNKSLQQSYTTQLAITNQTQLKFHKKINQLRTQMQQNKKLSKSNIKQMEKQIRKLSATVLGPNDKASIFIGTTTISQQLSQLSKQIIKCHKKQLNALKMQKDIIIQELNLHLQANKSRILELTCEVQKIKIRKNQLIQKSPVLNGHSISNRSSHSRGQLQLKQKQKQKEKDKNNERIQQKYEQKLKQIRNQLEQKDKFITQIRKKHDEQQTEMSQKQLQLQAKIAQKQMQFKYQQQKIAQMKTNSNQNEHKIKNSYQRQANKMKQKIKQLETLKQELKLKCRQNQEKLIGKEKQIREFDRKQKQAQEKLKRCQKKYESKIQELKRSISGKDKNIQQFIAKNQKLTVENKLLAEKLKIFQSSINLLKQSQKKSENQQGSAESKLNFQKIQNQFFLQKQKLETISTLKDQQIELLKEQVQQKLQSNKKKQQKITELTVQVNKFDNDLKLVKNQNEILKQTVEKLKDSNQKTNNFSQLKQQYEKRQKMLKSEGEKMLNDLKISKKQLQSQNKKALQQLSQLKQQNSKFKLQISDIQQQKLKLNAQKFKDSEKQRKLVRDYEQKIKKLGQKITQLQISSKNSSNLNKQVNAGAEIGKKKLEKQRSFKNTDSTQYTQSGMMTDRVVKKDQAINTIDLFAIETQQNGNNNKILELGDQPGFLNLIDGNQQEGLKNSNLFMNLNDNVPADEDVFQICDSKEEINFGQSQMKLQVRELFTNLRIQIQKLLNQQQISFATTKLLPPGLQDDYYQLMSYIKEKVVEIKVHNEISFIMAEAGNEPEQPSQISLELPGMIERHASERAGQSLRKIIQEKEALINSLMNQRTSQENTINQLTMEKEQIEQQNQNRFMNQCNVYKREIKQHKKTIDLLEMNFQSMKNVIRNVLQAFSQNEDMEDDFRESMTMYAKVGKLNQKQRSRINFYIQRYLEIKGLADQS